MAALRSQYRRGRRWWLIGTTLALAAAFMVVFVAASGANLTGSNFEGNDGNLVVNTAGNTDWANAPNRVRGDDLASGGTDNSFGQGTKEDDPNVSVVTGSIPPQKSDLTRFYVASEFASNSNFLYLAWERSNVLGSANMDFELNQQAQPDLTTTGPKALVRTAGDILITFDFGGSGNPVLGLLKWVTSGNTSQCFSSNSLPCWGNRVDLSAAGFAEGAVNSVTVTDPIANVSLPAGTFGEAAVNLTAAGVFPPGTCEALGSAFLKSRSSASFPAEVKDFVAPQPVSISNCGDITIHKVTENGDSSFGYTTTGGLVPATFSLVNGGSQPYKNQQVGSYSVTENLTAAQVTAGWTLKSLVCTGGTTSTSGSTASITLAAGDHVVCTYTNHINAKPTIATTLSANPVDVGSTVHDSATLTGATATAGGTVTYTVYTNATCTTGARDAGTVTVTNGVVPDSNGLVFNTAGDFYWQAVYSGDTNNKTATSVCTSEHLVVNKLQPTIATTLSANPVDVGSTVHDSATLTGATSNAGGTVTYTVYTNDTCTSGARDAGTVTVTNGVVPDSNGLLFDTAGDFFWQAVYSGDTNNKTATSVCTSEHLVVNKLQPRVSTIASGPVTVGDSISDTATLSGATTSAGGTITFRLFSDSGCTTEISTGLSPVSVSGNGSYNSGNFTPGTAGTYYWTASYSGDANNLPASTSCGDAGESSVVKAQPSITTRLSASPIGVGQSVTDSASLTGVTSDASGTVTYSVFANSSCTGTPVALGGTKTVTNGVVPDSNSVTFNSAGIFYWLVSYSGDAHNLPAISSCTSEQLTVIGACVLGYPSGTPPALSSVVFNESEVLRTSAAVPGGGSVAGPNDKIALWYNDEHALTLGVRRVIVKTSSGTTTTDYAITPLSTNPGNATNPSVGTTIRTGDQAGTDLALYNATYGFDINRQPWSGRPMWPALFITDITNNLNDRSGDWQQGGTLGLPPDDIFGTWKGAVRTVDKTHTPAAITVTADVDPAKNNWNLGSGSDTPPGGFASLKNEGYGAEVRWNVSDLGLTAGHAYRLQFMVHDGDQNKTGGDSGEACMNVVIPG